MHAGFGAGVREVFAQALETDDGDAVLFTDTRLGQREALAFFRGHHFDDGESVAEFHVVEEAAVDEVGDAPAGVSFGVDDVVGANAFEDAAVAGGDGFGPDLAGADIGEVGGGKNGRFHGRADADDGDGEVLGAHFVEDGGAGAVGFDDVGEFPGPGLDDAGVGVHGEHFVAEAAEG